PELEEVEKVEPVSDEEVKPEETSSITNSIEQVDAPVVEENVVIASVEETEVASPELEEVDKVEPVHDEEVKPEETSSITGSSEQVDAPVVEENVVEGLNSCSSATRGGKMGRSGNKLKGVGSD
nr:hypothetical protein [Tanacetum cinerariifolium]